MQVFLKSERVQKVVQAGGFSAHDFREVFRCNVEKRIRSLPEIDGLSKDTVLNSWMTKFDTIFRGEEDAAPGRGGRCSAGMIDGDKLTHPFQGADTWLAAGERRLDSRQGSAVRHVPADSRRQEV